MEYISVKECRIAEVYRFAPVYASLGEHKFADGIGGPAEHMSVGGHMFDVEWTSVEERRLAAVEAESNALVAARNNNFGHSPAEPLE